MYQNGTCRYIKTYSNEQEKSAKTGHFVISLVVLCLMSMDFKTRFFYFAFAVFGVTILMQRMHFELPQAFLPAMILAVSMVMFSPSAQGWSLAKIRPFAYPLCVIAGYNMIFAENRKDAEKQITAILIALAVGAFSHYALNMIFNWGKTTDRNTLDFWTKSILAATGQSSLASLMVGVAISVLFSDYTRKIKFIFLAILVCITYYNLMLGGRTLFVLMIVLMIANILAEWVRNKNAQKRMKILFILLLIVLLVFFIIRLNLFGVVDIFYSSNFFTRFFMDSGSDGFTQDGRMTYKMLFLENMLWYPLGGNELHKAVGNHYAHDIFLDTYSDSGIFAFFAIVTMVGYYIVRTIRTYRYKQTSLRFKKLLMNTMIVIVIVFCMEPTLDATPWLFASFCVFYGSLARLTEFDP